MTLPELTLPDTSVCPRCGAGLRCGMVAGDAQCWCVQLPNIMPVPLAPGVPAENLQKTAPAVAEAGSDTAPLPPAASCFFPACLKQITDASIHAPVGVNLEAAPASIPASFGANLEEVAFLPEKFPRPS